MACFLSLLFFFLISSVTACDRCIHQSTTAHIHYDVPTSYGGSCAYGNMEFEISKGYFATAAPSLLKQGSSCGACYQVRCNNKTLCNTIGTKVVLTGANYNNRTDFVLSRKAYSTMALRGKSQELLKIDFVDVEYKRIPCEYKNKNLLVQVVEWSRRPDVLAIKFLYQGGQTDIEAVNITQVHFQKWRPMIRNYGPTWLITEVPEGALKLKMMVTSGYNKKWISTRNYVLPADWENEKIYDTGIQIKDIMKEICPPYKCGDKPWK